MDVSFTKTFERELRKVSEKDAKTKISLSIENVEEAERLSDIKELKKLKGSDDAYRIKAGEYRLGLFINDKSAEFHRVKKRKDIYKYFPLFLLP